MDYRKGELAKNILKGLAIGLFIPASFLFPNLPKSLEFLLKELSKKHRTRPDAFRKSIFYLKKRKLIESKNLKNGETVLVLSEEGKIRLMQFDLEKIQIKKPKSWDKKWRIVIFDIPKSKNKARDALRNKLKDLGLYQLQKSCYVYPYECKEEIDFVSEVFDVSPYIAYIVAEVIEGEKILKENFNL